MKGNQPMIRIGVYDPDGWFTPELLSRIPGEVTRQAPAKPGVDNNPNSEEHRRDGAEWLGDKADFFASIDVFVGMTNGVEAMSFMTTAIRHLLDQALQYVFLIAPANTLGMLAALGDSDERDHLDLAVTTGRLGVFDDRGTLLEALEARLRRATP